MSGLLIVKTDEKTGKPLAVVMFDVKLADGQFVTGLIADGNQPSTPNNSQTKSTSENGDISGSYTTDANGRIQIYGMTAGEYMVVERKAIDGYELDTNVYNVTILPSKIATLQLTNKSKAGIRLVKIDSFTKKPIYNVEFILFDKNYRVVGVYYTDSAGIIDFPADLSEGRYTIRETRAAGYYADDMPRTVEFVAGQVTEIVWENTPQLGQIQILKKSADANEINGLPSGTPLAGATFEVYNYRTGALVDRFVSGNDGRAVSNPLPLGRYLIKEVVAPKYYILSDKTLDIEIEFATQIIKQEFLNYSANTSVYIRKTGNVEAMCGDVIRYDINITVLNKRGQLRGKVLIMCANLRACGRTPFQKGAGGFGVPKPPFRDSGIKGGGTKFAYGEFIVTGVCPIFYKFVNLYANITHSVEKIFNLHLS